MMYLIQMVRNPYVWNSGDDFTLCKDEETMKYWTGFHQRHTVFADPARRDTGYDGAVHLEMKVYEIKEVTDEVLHE